MKTALVTAIGSFSADIVIKNLKKLGMRVIGCDIYPGEWIADASQVHCFYQAPYATQEESYVEFILEVCSREKVNMVLPLTDVEVDVLNLYRDRLAQNRIQVCISSPETLKRCRNKWETQQFIREQIPEIRTIPTVSAWEMQEPPESYPAVCKPVDGRSSQGLRYIHNDMEWESFCRCEDLRRYIVQPYVEGSIVTVDVVADSMGNCAAIARKELLRTMNGAGTSVLVFRNPDLEERCRVLARALGILGCVNFEFILDDRGEYHFIECNPRFSGGVEFSCMVGYDCVSNHVRAFLGESIDDCSWSRDRYIARKYEEYVTKVL